MNKSIYKFLVGVSLISFSATTIPYFSSTQIVQAKAKSVKRKLYHKSYVYNSKGKATGVLPKGITLKTFGTKTIKKKKYYKIGTNQYVKQANFSKTKKKATTSTKKETSTTKTNLKTAKEVIAYLNKKKGKKDWFVLSGTSEKNDFYYVLNGTGHNYMVYTNGTIKKVK